MKTETRAPRLAVLIDADNAPSKIATRLFGEIAKIGDASVRRAYGDFSGTRLKHWADVLAPHAIKAQQNFAFTTGKNISDIAMVIDAMDLMHAGQVDGFCLISSDSDFTGLALRIREQGMPVYGFGEKKTPTSFRQSCSRFTCIESFMTDAAPKPAVKKAAPPTPPAAEAEGKLEPAAATPLMLKAVKQLDPEGGWVALTRVRQKIIELASDFDQRSYGHAKLSVLATKTGAFDTRHLNKRGFEIRPKGH